MPNFRDGERKRNISSFLRHHGGGFSQENDYEEESGTNAIPAFYVKPEAIDIHPIGAPVGRIAPAA